MAKAEDTLSLDALTQCAATMGAETWRTSSDVAQVAANYLRCHPRVTCVRYPGLREDALYAQAANTLQRGFGPIVAFELTVPGVEPSWRILDCEGLTDARATVLALEKALKP